MNEKYDIMKNGKGFIGALDQSGGSSAKTLGLYGIEPSSYNGDEEMFNLIHQMRTRVIKSNSFDNSHILGVILFEVTMNNKVDDEYTADYLWNKKHIVSFLKIDKGLDELKDGVQIMKPIPGLLDSLDHAVKMNIFGTKMRSVIKEANREGIKKVVAQQFELAKIICTKGLVPIVEPEVDINNVDKVECEKILMEEIDNNLLTLKDEKIMLKLTLPTVDNFYEKYTNHPNIVRVVALSGGYSREEANRKLGNNKGVIASFSRALLEGLNVNQTEEEFDKTLLKSVTNIYDASIK